MDIVHKPTRKRADPEAKGDCWKEPTRTQPLARHVGWNLEKDVADVENTQNAIVVVAPEVQVFLEPGQFRVACS